jgi:hypothetical protein
MDQPPSLVVTYRPPRGADGCQVELMIDTWDVATRLEAIEKAAN